ncbi:MAG: serine hydrolase [Candidatus Kapaibacterium sp.]
MKNLTPEQNSNITKRLLLSLISFIAGAAITALAIFAFRGKSSADLDISYSETSHPAPGNKNFLVNPLYDCEEYRLLNFREIKTFESDIRNYIKNFEMQDTVFHISVYYRDLNSGYWFGINEKEKFSPSSLMKVPILIAIFKIAETNSAILEKQIKYINSRAGIVLGNHSQNSTETQLVEGESYSVEQLIEYMIVNSDNEATILLYDLLFAYDRDFLIQVQEDLGFQLEKNVSYGDNIMSVKSYSSFFRVLYNASYLSPGYSQKALELLASANYPFGIREAVPGDVEVAHKWGINSYFDGEQNIFRQLHHAGIVYMENKPYLLAIMTRGDSREHMNKAIYDISSIIYNSLDKELKEHPSSYLGRDME